MPLFEVPAWLATVLGLVAAAAGALLYSVFRGVLAKTTIDLQDSNIKALNERLTEQTNRIDDLIQRDERKSKRIVELQTEVDNIKHIPLARIAEDYAVIKGILERSEKNQSRALDILQALSSQPSTVINNTK